MGLKNRILNEIVQVQNAKDNMVSKMQVLASKLYTCICVGGCIEPRKLEMDP